MSRDCVCLQFVIVVFPDHTHYFLRGVIIMMARFVGYNQVDEYNDHYAFK